MALESEPGLLTWPPCLPLPLFPTPHLLFTGSLQRLGLHQQHHVGKPAQDAREWGAAGAGRTSVCGPRRALSWGFPAPCLRPLFLQVLLSFPLPRKSQPPISAWKRQSRSTRTCSSQTGSSGAVWASCGPAGGSWKPRWTSCRPRPRGCRNVSGGVPSDLRCSACLSKAGLEPGSAACCRDGV